jgi:hypothetical protein
LSRTSDENRWERKPKPLGHRAPQPSTWRGRSKHILLNQLGREAEKAPGGGLVSFLDFSLYRTILELSDVVAALPPIDPQLI